MRGGRRKEVYLLDHFLDEFVGGFKVLWVRAIQQSGQHLREQTARIHMGGTRMDGVYRF